MSYKPLTLLALVGLIALPLAAQDQPPETDAQRQMAAQMAAWMDQVWETTPSDGTANLRVLLTQDGEPLALEPSIYGAFAFRARSGPTHIHQSFNPNSHGRWVHEGLEPGTYTVVIEGSGEYEGWTWTQDGIVLDADTAPLLEITVGG